MWNPYLDDFEDLQEQSTFKGQQWFGKRKDLVEEYSWAVPNEDALVYVSEFDEIVEVGAGNGYWARCIDEAGGNVDATDIDPADSLWTDVEQVTASDVAIDERPVLLVWPPYDEPMAWRVAEREPSHLLYVGEPRGGCTGSSEFFDIVEQKYGLVAMIEIPSYVGIHDDLYHYVRKV